MAQTPTLALLTLPLPGPHHLAIGKSSSPSSEEALLPLGLRPWLEWLPCCEVCGPRLEARMGPADLASGNRGAGGISFLLTPHLSCASCANVALRPIYSLSAFDHSPGPALPPPA